MQTSPAFRMKTTCRATRGPWGLVLGVTISPTKPMRSLAGPSSRWQPTRTAGAPRAPRSGSGAAAPPEAVLRVRSTPGAADVDRRHRADQDVTMTTRLVAERLQHERRGRLQNRCSATMVRREDVAELGEFVAQRAGRDDLGALPDGSLEQERLWRAGEAFVLVVAGGQRHARGVAGEAADDRGDDVDQFRADRDDTFAVGLGRGDHEQGDHLAVWPLVLADAELGQLNQLLGAQPGVGEGLHGRPLPERGVFGERHVDGLARGEIEDTGISLTVDAGRAGVAGGVDPLLA